MQILNASKLKLLFILSYLPIILSSCGGLPPSSTAAPPIPVKFNPALTRTFVETFQTSGDLKANKEVTVSAIEPGVVKKIFPNEGAYVHKGQKLFQIKGDGLIADFKYAESELKSYEKLYQEEAISQNEYLRFKANFERLKANIEDLDFKSIISGQIGKIYIDEGDYVRAGDPILDLIQVYPLEVSFEVPEKLISKISQRQKLEVQTNDKTQTYGAKINFIAPKVNKNTRTILVRATLNQNYKNLKPNQFVEIKLILENRSSNLAIPEEALYFNQAQEYVFLAQKANEEEEFYVATKIPIQTGIRQNGMIEIISGIEPGANVIYSGLYSIYPGAKLINVTQ